MYFFLKFETDHLKVIQLTMKYEVDRIFKNIEPFLTIVLTTKDLTCNFMEMNINLINHKTCNICCLISMGYVILLTIYSTLLVKTLP